MTLQGTVTKASAGLIGFDCDTALSASQAAHYAAQGYRFCIRYVSRDEASREYNDSSGTPDLTAEEAAAILASGMALMAVQHVAKPGWNPTATLGAAYGANAAAYAASAGLPPGVNLWLDLEGIGAGAATKDIVTYCNTWFSEVASAGYVPGIYVGYDTFLSPDQLYFDLTTQHYWRAGGEPPDVSHRGYQLIQNIANAGSLQAFDRNVTQDDAFGGAVIWLAPT